MKYLLILLLASCGVHIAEIETDKYGDVAERIYFDGGGHVRTEVEVWAARRRDDDIQYYVIDGICASFCAWEVFLGPRTCFTKNAVLSVHPILMFGIYENQATRNLTQSFVDRWPLGLRDWWTSNRPTMMGRDLGYDQLMQIIPEKECRVGKWDVASQDATN